jgi:hypothetical protein
MIRSAHFLLQLICRYFLALSRERQLNRGRPLAFSTVFGTASAGRRDFVAFHFGYPAVQTAACASGLSFLHVGSTLLTRGGKTALLEHAFTRTTANTATTLTARHAVFLRSALDTYAAKSDEVYVSSASLCLPAEVGEGAGVHTSVGRGCGRGGGGSAVVIRRSDALQAKANISPHLKYISLCILCKICTYTYFYR